MVRHRLALTLASGREVVVDAHTLLVAVRVGLIGRLPRFVRRTGVVGLVALVGAIIVVAPAAAIVR